MLHAQLTQNVITLEVVFIRIEHAYKILNSLVADLTMAVTVIKDYEERGQLTEIQRKALYRLCFSELVIHCSKYVELCRKYGQQLNQEIPDLNSLKNNFSEEIKRKGIVSFRNDYVGHIHSKKLKRPLTDEEVQNRIIDIIGSDNPLDFLNWICPDNLSSTDMNKSLVGVISQMRDALGKKL